MGWLQSGPALYAAFAGTFVEFLEALTVVLAVGAARGWAGALGGVGLALGFLLVVLTVFGSGLSRLPQQPLHLVVGILALLFGLRWLRKAMLRSAGILELRDETAIYARRKAAAEAAGGRVGRWDGEAVGLTLQITLLEGLEAAFIVLAVGTAAPNSLLPATLGAVAALSCVGLLGLLLRRPILAVPDTVLKLGVGVTLCAFGTFWIGEGGGLPWPAGDWSLPALLTGYAAAAWVGIGLCRAVRHRSERRAPGRRLR